MKIKRDSMTHKNEFDTLIKDYKHIRDENVQISGETSEYFNRYKCNHFQYLFKRGSLKTKPYILDYGCGNGSFSIELSASGFKGFLFGLDVSFECLKEATKNTSKILFIHFDGFKIPLKEEAFDYVLLVNVLHHIQPHKRQEVLSKVTCLLKKGGKLVIYEHNPLNPITNFAFKHNLIDKNAKMLSFCEAKNLTLLSNLRIIKRGFIVFFPRILKIFRFFEPYLSFLPLGAQYFVVGEKS